MLPGRRCSTPWISRQLGSSPLMNGRSSAGSTLLPRLQPWIHIPSLIREPLMSTRTSSRKLSNPSSAEAVELYWYMLEIFTDHDADKDGIIKLEEFSAMMKECLAVPLKHELPVPTEDQFEVLFKKYDPRNDGRLTVDEWMSLAKEEVYKKYDPRND